MKEKAKITKIIISKVIMASWHESGVIRWSYIYKKHMYSNMWQHMAA